MAHRVLERRKVLGKMAKLWEESMITSELKRELYERAMIPTVVHNSKTRGEKVEAFELMRLSSICGIGRVNRVRDSLREVRA